MMQQESRRTKVCPVVLAGGLSSRMGRDKAMLKLSGGQTMLAQAQNLLAGFMPPAGIDLGPVVTSGARPGGVPDKFEAAGPLGGLQAVTEYLRELGGDWDAMLVLPVDMPLVQAGHLRALCSAGQCVEQAVCFGSYFLPCWLPLNERSSAYLDAAARGNTIPSLRALFGYLGCMQLPVPDGDWHLNANCPEEFAQIAELVARSG